MHRKPINIAPIDFEKIDIAQLLKKKNLSPNIFTKSSTLKLTDTLASHVKWAYENIYSVNYPVGYSRDIHGIQHVSRVAIYIPVLALLFATFGSNITLNEKGLHLLQIAAIFHDAGREADGVDMWEKDSAILCYFYLTRILSVSKEKAEKVAYSIMRGEPGKPFGTLSSKLLHDADSLDIMRVRKEYDMRYLGFYKDYACKNEEAKKSLEKLIAEVKSWIAAQGDAYGHHDQEIKDDFSDEDAYEMMIAHLVDAKYEMLDPHVIDAVTARELTMEWRYNDLLSAVSLLEDGLGPESLERNNVNEKLRSALPEKYKTFDEALQNVKNFSKILNANKSLYTKDPDYYILKCVLHGVASVLSLGLYFCVRAGLSYSKRDDFRFWKPSEQLFVESAESELIALKV